MSKKLFVYGTLRGREGATPATIKGTMFNVGRFPAVVLDGDTEIHGEVVPVQEEEFIPLDRYEGIASGLYERLEAPVLVEGEEVLAEIYIAGPTLVGEITAGKLDEVPSGDWLNRG